MRLSQTLDFCGFRCYTVYYTVAIPQSPMKELKPPGHDAICPPNAVAIPQRPMKELKRIWHAVHRRRAERLQQPTARLRAILTPSLHCSILLVAFLSTERVSK